MVLIEVRPYGYVFGPAEITRSLREPGHPLEEFEANPAGYAALMSQLGTTGLCHRFREVAEAIIRSGQQDIDHSREESRLWGCGPVSIIYPVRGTIKRISFNLEPSGRSFHYVMGHSQLGFHLIQRTRPFVRRIERIVARFDERLYAQRRYEHHYWRKPQLCHPNGTPCMQWELPKEFYEVSPASALAEGVFLQSFTFEFDSVTGAVRPETIYLQFCLARGIIILLRRFLLIYPRSPAPGSA